MAVVARNAHALWSEREEENMVWYCTTTQLVFLVIFFLGSEELGSWGYAVLVYDMWGHGHSAVLNGVRYTPRLLGAQLRSVARHHS